ncbi:MAG: DUF2079 domain-containing protein [Bacteroidales bacterium]|nr:DUF2079 domain-containing protein [Bacteroidales bacterium]
MEQFFQRHRKIIFITVLVVFAVLFSLLSITNYFTFRTYGLDLGIYTKALYDYAHFRMCDSSFFQEVPMVLLGDHFDLYLLIFSPLVWLFGPLTLLIVQILAVLFGAVGIYKLIHLYSDTESIPFAAMLSFLSFFGIWHALSFDYHSNVVATMFLPWLLYFFKSRCYGKSSLMLLLMVIAKETIPLWLCFVFIALLWDYRNDKKAMAWLGAYTVFCFIYLSVVTLWVMPHFNQGSSPGFWRYEYMGSNFKEIALWILSHPIETMQNLFGIGNNGSLKVEFYICALASGLLLTCFKPNYLIMLVPLMAQKMLSSDLLFWGVVLQYGVEFAPVLVIASFIVIARIHQEKWQTALVVATVLLSIGTTIYTVDTPVAPIFRERLRIYSASHYQQNEFDMKVARRMLQQIPNGASVCATTFFTPHLALRDSIYMFPYGLHHNAEYFLVKKEHWCYTEGDMEIIAMMISDTSRYEILDTDGDLYLLRKKR